MQITAVPFESRWIFPLSLESVVFSFNVWFAACFPKVTINDGLRRRSCCDKKVSQACFSSSLGSRSPGGRHFKVFVMYTFLRGTQNPFSIIFVSSFPASPTKGNPSLSSSAPGASPINTISGLESPDPNTVCVRDL